MTGLALLDRPPWPLQPGACPCDLHLTAWLKARGISGSTILHFGTGEHHHVGLNAGDNSVVGVTVSRAEADRYLGLCADDPDLQKRYRVVHGDIYGLTADDLPMLDVASLPHLGEYSGDPDRDADLLRLVTGRLWPDAHVVFYRRSRALRKEWPFDVHAIIADWAASCGARRLDDYEHLMIYRC